MNKTLKNVIKYAGAFVACAIGSGFATGQEIMQFFTGQGAMGVAGAVVTTVLFSLCGYLFMKHGYKQKLYTPILTTEYYFGKKVGKIVEAVFQIFLFGVYAIMIAGSGATISQFFGLPQMVGRILMVLLALITVILGLNTLTEIIGKIGPVIIVVALIIGIYSFCNGTMTFQEAAALVPTLDITITKGGWLVSSVLYPAFNAVVVIYLSCSMGATAESEKEASLGGLIGGFMFGLAVLIMNLGLFVNVKDIWALSVPTLSLAQTMGGRIFAVFFAVIIVLGIYTTTVPMLWGIVRHFAEDKTKKSVIFACVFSVVGLLLGMTDFKVLVNIIYPFSGYAGLILMAFAIYREIKDRK